MTLEDLARKCLNAVVTMNPDRAHLEIERLCTPIVKAAEPVPETRTEDSAPVDPGASDNPESEPVPGPDAPID